MINLLAKFKERRESEKKFVRTRLILQQVERLRWKTQSRLGDSIDDDMWGFLTPSHNLRRDSVASVHGSAVQMLAELWIDNPESASVIEDYVLNRVVDHVNRVVEG